MMSDKKMLILRGNADNTGKVYPDEQGNFIAWPKGALHEEAAKEYARRKGYQPVVLDVSGESGPGSAQTSQALIMLRDKGGDEFKALYGFSGGGYNVRWILTALKKDERKRFELIVVLGAPPTVLKDGKFVYSPTGSPQKPAFLKSSFDGGNWDLVYQDFTPSSFKTPKKTDGHMFLPEWLLALELFTQRVLRKHPSIVGGPGPWLKPPDKP
jgi:hypothetical protein